MYLINTTNALTRYQTLNAIFTIEYLGVQGP